MLVNLLHIFKLYLAIYFGLNLLPHFKVDGQSIEDYSSYPLNLPIYYRDRPVFLERPIILTQPKLVVPNQPNQNFQSNQQFQPNDYLQINGHSSIYSSYKPNEPFFDKDLEFSSSKRKKRRRRRKRRRRFG